jgi:hypothetical protein
MSLVLLLTYCCWHQQFLVFLLLFVFPDCLAAPPTAVAPAFACVLVVLGSSAISFFLLLLLCLYKLSFQLLLLASTLLLSFQLLFAFLLLLEISSVAMSSDDSVPAVPAVDGALLLLASLLLLTFWSLYCCWLSAVAGGLCGWRSIGF